MVRRLARWLPLLMAASAGCRASATAGSGPDAAVDPDKSAVPAPSPKTAPPAAPPAAPPNKDKACEQDSECMLLPPAPCECPPCGKVPRNAVNRKIGERRVRAWEQEDHDCSLRAVPCRTCTGELIGSEAACTDRQCVAVP